MFLGLFSTQTNAQIGMDLDEAIKIGSTTATTNGLIRYTGSDFEGRIGGAWVSLTGGGAASPWTADSQGVKHSNTGINWARLNTTTANSIGLRLERNDTQEAFIWHEDSSGDLIFTNTNGSTRHMVIDGPTKYVGINESSPDEQLHVTAPGNNGIKIEGNDTGDTRLWIQNGPSNNHFIFDDDSDSHALKIQSVDDLDFLTGGVNTRMRIDGVTGQVHVEETFRVDGTSSLSGKVTASNDIQIRGSDPRLEFWNSSPPTVGAEVYFDEDGTQVPPNNGGNAGDLVLRNTRSVGDIEFFIDNTDKVFRMSSAGIVESLGDRLEVRHNSGTLTRGLRVFNTVNSNWFQFYASSSSNNMTLVNSANDIIGSWSATGVYSSSDEKLKENIRNTSYGINTAMALSAKSYNFKKGDTRDAIGFIAQEVKEVVPELVLFDEETDTHMVNYAGMSVIAIKAIQDQQAQIEALKAENEEMKAQMEEVLKRLDK